MSTKYGMALSAPSTQNILPAQMDDGTILGWYPIATTTFTGAETSFTLSDNTVPLKTVTIDTGNGNQVFQYMAAVFSTDLRFNTQPWASVNLIAPDSGYYRSWSMPSEGSRLHYGEGILQAAIEAQNLVTSATPGSTTPSTPIVVTPVAITWNSSIAYEMINGSCSFFDIPWVTLFTQTQDTVPLRISVVSLPPAIGGASPFTASLLGQPVATVNGNLYDTIRIIRLLPPGLIPVGVYTFVFTITTVENTSANVTLNLTIA
jgi:hypothetical protein